MLNTIEQKSVHIAKHSFEFRFPRNGEKQREKAWREEYERWWIWHYDYHANINSWLRIPRGAAFVLTCNIAEETIEAAVNDPLLQISRLAVEKRKLSSFHFALAIAHPEVSVFAPFDAKDIDPKEQEKYLEWQRINGMTQREIDDAFVQAQAIIVGRKPFVIRGK